MLSIFAAFEFDWPPALMSIFNSVSLAAFNLELLAPECRYVLHPWLRVPFGCGRIPFAHSLASRVEVVGVYYCWCAMGPYSFSVSYAAKWMVTQSLPLILVGSVGIVVLLTRVLQFVQRKVFKVLPFGAAGDLHLSDICLGVMITGSYYLYFRTWVRALSQDSLGGNAGFSLVPVKCALPLLLRVATCCTDCVLRYLVVDLLLRVLGTVIVRSSLIPFGCTTRNGVSTLNAEPSIVCSTDNASFRLMRPVGTLCLVAYGLGLPLLFATLLRRNYHAIVADQLLRSKGQGETSLTNPSIHIRRRYRKLYEDYKPQFAYWKLVLIARKLVLAVTGIVLAGNASLQVSALCCNPAAAWAKWLRFDHSLPCLT